MTHSVYESVVENKYALDTVSPYANVYYSGEENCIHLVFQDIFPSALENSECTIKYCIFPYNVVSSYEQVTPQLLEKYGTKTVTEKLDDDGNVQFFIYKCPMDNFEKDTSYSIYTRMSDAAGNYRDYIYSFAITNPPDWNRVSPLNTYKKQYDGFELGRYVFTCQENNFNYITPAGIFMNPTGENSCTDTDCNIAMLFESSKGLKIEYDQSCIVQTYYSRRNLGSDISDWVLFGTEYNTIEYVPEKSGEYNSSYYYTKKPEDLTINWDETYYYITVCFFSDLTRCTSSVREWHAFE